MQRINSTDWSVGNPITSARLQNFNEDLDRIFQELSNDNVTLTYNANGQLTQIVDVENTITINLDWTNFSNSTSELYIQKAGDPKKWTVGYNINGYIASILYA